MKEASREDKDGEMIAYLKFIIGFCTRSVK